MKYIAENDVIRGIHTYELEIKSSSFNPSSLNILQVHAPFFCNNDRMESDYQDDRKVSCDEMIDALKDAAFGIESSMSEDLLSQGSNDDYWSERRGFHRKIVEETCCEDEGPLIAEIFVSYHREI